MLSMLIGISQQAGFYKAWTGYIGLDLLKIGDPDHDPSRKSDD